MILEAFGSNCCAFQNSICLLTQHACLLCSRMCRVMKDGENVCVFDYAEFVCRIWQNGKWFNQLLKMCQKAFDEIDLVFRGFGHK